MCSHASIYKFCCVVAFETSTGNLLACICGSFGRWNVLEIIDRGYNYNVYLKTVGTLIECRFNVWIRKFFIFMKIILKWS